MDEILDRYLAAVRIKDVEAFLALYADDIRTFDLWSVWSTRGRSSTSTPRRPRAPRGKVSLRRN